MAFNFPWEMFVQAQQAKNQNQNQMNQNIAGMGQSLGTTLTDLGNQNLEYRKRSLIRGLFKDNPELAALAQIDPASAFKIHQEQINQRPLFQGPDGEIAITPQPGYAPLGNYDKEISLKVMENQGEKRRSQELQKLQIEGNVETRRAMNEITKMLGEGRIQDAKNRLDEVHQKNVSDRTLKAQMENAKYPFRNAYRSFMGKGPVIPMQEDQSTGGVQVMNFKVTQ